MEAAMEHSLQTSLSSFSQTAGTERRFVHLSQPVPDPMSKTATMFDIAQMVARAKSGQSARSYKESGCPAGVTESGITVNLEFYSWPSSPTLAYTVRSSFGFASQPEPYEENVEFSLKVEKTNVVELDFMLKNITEFYWETACYTLEGERTRDAKAEMDGLHTIRLDKKVFGVLRIRGVKVGAKHTVESKLIPWATEEEEEEPANVSFTDLATWDDRPVDQYETADFSGLNLDNLQITVTAKWYAQDPKENDLFDREQMRLTIPQCIQDLLSACGANQASGHWEDGVWVPGAGHWENGIWIFDDESLNEDKLNICDTVPAGTHQVVYVSSCTNKAIDSRTVEDDIDFWCEQ